VDINASKQDIKKAFFRMSQEHHPDKNPDDPDAQARFLKIKAAFDAIKDGVGVKQEVKAEPFFTASQISSHISSIHMHRRI
jgi:curved DNA-binding protein CbpA